MRYQHGVPRLSIWRVMYWILLGLAFWYILWHLFWFVIGFGTMAPGDFPWEDVTHQPVTWILYRIAGVFEAFRDIMIYG